MNKVVLRGRLGSHPIQRTTKSGRIVTNFSMATNHRVMDPDAAPGSNAKVEETVWHKVVVWGKQAEACTRNLDKGQAVLIEGGLRSRAYTLKDGTQKRTFEVVAENVTFLGMKRTDPSPSAPVTPVAPVGVDAETESSSYSEPTEAEHEEALSLAS